MPDDRPLPSLLLSLVCQLFSAQSIIHPKSLHLLQQTLRQSFRKNKVYQTLSRYLTDQGPDPSWGLYYNINYRNTANMFGKKEAYTEFAKPSSYPISIPQNNAFINLHCNMAICHSVLPTSETKCESLLNYFNLC